MNWSRPPFEVSDDPARLDVAAIHEALNHSYWSPGVPRPVVERALSHSLCLGLYHGAAQIGLARAVTDRATFAYLCDILVQEAWRGQGLGTWLVECLLSHPELQALRRLHLVTRDAHALYRKFGFLPLANPEMHLERWDPEVYKRAVGGDSPGP